LPIPILPTQPKRWNQHSLLKRIPSDSLFEEFALAEYTDLILRSAKRVSKDGPRGVFILRDAAQERGSSG
jgi:hypothetical protein